MSFSWLDQIAKNKREVVLANINQETEFSKILRYKIDVSKGNINTLRGESIPSLRFKYFPDNTLYARDFGRTSYSGDIIDWIRFYHQKVNNKIITDITAIKYLIEGKTINSNLKLDTSYKTKKEKTYSIIEVEAFLDSNGLATYTKEDFNFWGRIGIKPKDIDLLRSFGIFSCKRVWQYELKDNKKKLIQVLSRTKDSPIYAYYFGPSEFKIYSPYADKRNKWRCNTDKIDDIGMLPSNFIILTKSKKDRVALRLLGYESYCFDSENKIPKDLPYKTSLVFYDNDWTKEDKDNTGLQIGRAISLRFNIPYTLIPSKYECTDVSELLEKYGYRFTSKILKSLIDNAKIYRRAEKTPSNKRTVMPVYNTN